MHNIIISLHRQPSSRTHRYPTQHERTLSLNRHTPPRYPSGLRKWRNENWGSSHSRKHKWYPHQELTTTPTSQTHTGTTHHTGETISIKQRGSLSPTRPHKNTQSKKTRTKQTPSAQDNHPKIPSTTPASSTQHTQKNGNLTPKTTDLHPNSPNSTSQLNAAQTTVRNNQTETNKTPHGPLSEDPILQHRTICHPPNPPHPWRTSLRKPV